MKNAYQEHLKRKPTHPSALSRCLLEEASAIVATAQRLDHDQVESALQLLDSCAKRRGKLVLSGVGKSGIVARKIAATFSSIGLMAIYLNPLDALHGDLGVVSSDDLAMLLSNSGETEELIQILPHLKRRGTPQIALIGKPDSTLAKACDVVLDGSVDREICPLNLAPTASTAVAMAIGDALAAVWMERSGVSQADFAVNHPAGSLGKQLTLTAEDLMVPVSRLEPLQPSTSLPAVIAQITATGIGACWVCQPEAPHRIRGLITDGDLRRALQQHGPTEWEQLQATDLMTVDPITVPRTALAIDAMKRMECNRRKEIAVLPVVNEQQDMVGLLRLHDLVQAGLT